MKVYYDLPEEAVEAEDIFLENYLADYENYLADLWTSKNTVKIYNKLTEIMCVKQKYQIMWGLRSIENEINEEGGRVIITKEGRIKIQGFTKELKTKIYSLLS